MATKSLKIKESERVKNFTEFQKQEIMKRDNYRCVFCGQGIENGVELQVEQIQPNDQEVKPQ